MSLHQSRARFFVVSGVVRAPLGGVRGEGGLRRRRLGITRSAVLPTWNGSRVDATVPGVAVSGRRIGRRGRDCGGRARPTMIAKPPSPAAAAVSAGPPFAFTEINNRPCVIASFRVYTVYRTYCSSATRQRLTLSVPNSFRSYFFRKKNILYGTTTSFYYVVTRSVGPNTRASSQHG